MNCCGKFSLNFLYLFYYKIKDVPSKYIDGVFETDTRIDMISLLPGKPNVLFNLRTRE